MCRKTIKAMAIILQLSVGASAAWAQQIGVIDRSSAPASLVSILASPSTYQDKRIRTIGVLFLEPEASADSGTIALFLTKEQMEHFISPNALSLNLSAPGFYEDLALLNGKYVIVEGLVDALETGHMGVFAAGLIDVNRIQLVGSEK
jgi:hypothetical protein